MSTCDEFSFSLKSFSGKVRLFPLPNLVLFPHVMQPLRIFEPRYLELLKEAMADDRLITLAMLAPGWERDYEGRPPLFPVACLGRVLATHRLPTGAHNVLVVGLKRVRLLRELPPRKSFREAKVEVCEDSYPMGDASATVLLQRKLRGAFVKALPNIPQIAEQLEQIIDSKISLGTLTDIISYLLDIGLVEKQTLLAEVDIRRRTELLLDQLVRIADDTAPGAAGVLGFPPQFSTN